MRRHRDVASPDTVEWARGTTTKTVTLLSISDEIITDSLLHCREIVCCLVWSQEHILPLSFSPKPPSSISCVEESSWNLVAGPSVCFYCDMQAIYSCHVIG